MRTLNLSLVVMSLLAAPAWAQMEHEHMMSHDMAHTMDGQQQAATAPTSLPPLATLPGSGKARESGMDGRHIQEATGVGTAESERCALAARGIVMLDNASWAACGGKTAGIPQAPAALSAPTTTHQHMMH